MKFDERIQNLNSNNWEMEALVMWVMREKGWAIEWIPCVEGLGDYKIKGRDIEVGVRCLLNAIHLGLVNMCNVCVYWAIMFLFLNAYELIYHMPFPTSFSLLLFLFVFEWFFSIVFHINFWRSYIIYLWKSKSAKTFEYSYSRCFVFYINSLTNMRDLKL